MISSKAHFPYNVFHEITGITDKLKKNAHDQNEQAIHEMSKLFYPIIFGLSR